MNDTNINQKVLQLLKTKTAAVQ